MSTAAENAFWQEKVRWAANGDRTPDGAHTLRIAGQHYIALPGNNTGIGTLGFDGAVFRWRDITGAEIGRGLANYSSAEARLLCRKPSSEIAQLLGYSAEPEMVHRDNRVLTR